MNSYCSLAPYPGMLNWYEAIVLLSWRSVSGLCVCSEIRSSHTLSSYLFFILKYLSIFRERGREGERQGERLRCGKEISVVCLSPGRRLNPQPRYVPWPEIESTNCCFMRGCPTYSAILPRAMCGLYFNLRSPPGTEPPTQAWALTRNQTRDLSLC